jgi:phosphohistidine phosphatase
MKTVLILRHAKSSWKHPELDDHDRPLNKRGKQDAPRIGALMRKEDLLPDLILSSTARRAQATAESVVEASGYEGEVFYAHELYAAGPEAYLEALSAVDDEKACVMVVGHNPGLEELLQELTGDGEHLPTGALARVELDVQIWRELAGEACARPCGRLTGMWTPRGLD